jgi:hypothetical protein
MGDACLRCGDKATEVDHIIELANGGTDDVDNLQPLCSACHKAKTAQFNSQRLKLKTEKDFAKEVESNGFFWQVAPPPTLSISSLSLKPTIEPPIAQRSPERAK